MALLTTNVTALLDDFADRVYEEVRHPAPATWHLPPVLSCACHLTPTCLSRNRPAIDDSSGGINSSSSIVSEVVSKLPWPDAHRWLSPPPPLWPQLNYVQEARNARRFRQLYADQRDVVVPRAYWEFTATKVLVMDWVRGRSLFSVAFSWRSGTGRRGHVV